jgi:thiamine-monophosphate kinase
MVLVHELGEKELIRTVLSRHVTTAHVDGLEDCVVIDLDRLSDSTGAPLFVYSVDHPSPIDRPLPPRFETRFFGRWLAACTCNDVLAMGARPRGFALDLAVRADTDVEFVTELYAGVEDVLAEYGAAFEGGNVDINQSTQTVGMSWGTVDRTSIIRRRGARPGDVVAVTTELGIGWASYLLRKCGRFDSLSTPAREQLESYNLMPLAPHRAIVESVTRCPGAITSGMDLSDGLAEYLHLIAMGSGLGVRVEEWRFPVSPLLKECAAALDVPASALIIEYGFDMPRAHGYTIAPESWNDVEEIFVGCGSAIFRVGSVTEESGVIWVPLHSPPAPLPQLWDDKCRRADAIATWFSAMERLVD